MTKVVFHFAAICSLAITAPAALASVVLGPDLASLAQKEYRVATEGDYVCQAKIYGKKSLLWLEDNKPVKYQANNKYWSARMREDTIYIGDATLSNVVIGRTSNGKKALQGDWKLGSYRQKDVLFTCNPE